MDLDNDLRFTLSGPAKARIIRSPLGDYVVVEQGPARFTFYDEQSLDSLVSAFLDAQQLLPEAKAPKGTCGWCEKEDVPLAETVGNAEQTATICFGCSLLARERAA